MFDYLAEAFWICDFVKSIADRDKLLPVRLGDVETGEIMSPEHMVNDLGDYVQNVWYAGEKEFAIESAIRAAELYQNDRGLFSDDWYENEDVFVGLTDLYELSKDAGIKFILNRFIDGVKKNLGKASPRGYIEYLSLNGEIESARAFAERYLDCGYASNSGFINLQKTNTNLAHGFIELRKVTGEDKYRNAIKKWIETVESKFYVGGIYKNNYFYGLKWSHKKEISPSIAVLSVYADFGELNLLKERLDAIIGTQTGIGFFRDSPYNKKSEKHNRGFLDNQTDMAVLLLKAYCLTKNDCYLESAKKCVEAVCKYLKRPYGYIEYFNAETGNVWEHKRMYVKYLTLFIKALILLNAVLKGKNIYEDKDLLILSKDR